MRSALALVAAVILAGSLNAQTCVDSAKVVAPTMSESQVTEYTKNLDAALAEYAAKPTADNLIWVARRQGYLGKYRESIATAGTGISKFPGDARMLRHRGHRFLTLRCFDDAIRDFEAAAKLTKGHPDQIEPDGLPNAKNIPTSTLQSNIWYHLGLAYYLKRDFKNALRAYKEAQKVSKNNDMRVATSYWHYMTLRRMGRTRDAERVLEPFAGQVELIENTEYLRLIKLNRGQLRPEDLIAGLSPTAGDLGSASLAYGIGNYFLYNGDKEKATSIFRRIVGGDQWSSFGYIAAERELAQ